MNPCTDPEFCIPNPKGGHVPCPVCPHGAGALTCSPPSKDKDACCSETPKSDQLIEAQQALGTALKHLRETRHELTKARLDVERMNWIEKHSTQIFCFENVAGNVERYEVASCRAMIDREISQQNDLVQPPAGDKPKN